MRKSNDEDEEEKEDRSADLNHNENYFKRRTTLFIYILVFGNIIFAKLSQTFKKHFNKSQYINTFGMGLYANRYLITALEDCQECGRLTGTHTGWKDSPKG